ncbi:WG repeat-containing protein [Paenibacillus thalictri]|uniref:WG repeat-containing protein n=1 Tax=Paenibacillus thalictri TaxID=2527873 RepID=A0A4Q9DH55_9BACL|nr:WG repeat-containing protein [Paenibacillus thalictri]TBL69959.1 WG repeat-containing protein [Paenibacillus thalictri]
MGFIDKTGSIVIEPEYLNVYKHGFIDKTGSLVIKPIYDYATDFIDGLAFVAKDGQGYLIDRSGTVIRERAYNSIEKFSENVLQVRSTEASNYKLGLIDNAGNVIEEPVYKTIGKLNEGLASYS